MSETRENIRENTRENIRNAEQEQKEDPKAYGRDEEVNSLAWKPLKVEHLIDDEWMDLRRVTYGFPDGSSFGPYYNYSRRNYVVILASDTEGNFLLVRQYRHGIRKVTTEFPAGGIEGPISGEGRQLPSRQEALETAKRELLEETGYVSSSWEYLYTVPSAATIADNYAYLFRAKDCVKVSGQSLDETEYLHYIKLSPQEIDQLVEREEFHQAIHVMAWLMAKQRG